MAQILRDNDLKVMALNRALEVEETLLLASGVQVTELIRKAPLHDEQGNLIGIIGLSLNIFLFYLFNTCMSRSNKFFT